MNSFYYIVSIVTAPLQGPVRWMFHFINRLIINFFLKMFSKNRFSHYQGDLKGERKKKEKAMGGVERKKERGAVERKKNGRGGKRERNGRGGKKVH